MRSKADEYRLNAVNCVTVAEGTSDVAMRADRLAMPKPGEVLPTRLTGTAEPIWSMRRPHPQGRSFNSSSRDSPRKSRSSYLAQKLGPAVDGAFSLRKALGTGGRRFGLSERRCGRTFPSPRAANPPRAPPSRRVAGLLSTRSGAAMRWLLAILLVLLLVIVDQFQFRGYYTSEASRLVRNAITSVTR